MQAPAIDANVEKSINSLIGIVRGISIDGNIHQDETRFLSAWIDENVEIQHIDILEPLINEVNRIVHMGGIDEIGRHELLTICQSFVSSHHLTEEESAINVLAGIIKGISSDDSVSTAEASMLDKWMKDNAHLAENAFYHDLFEVLRETLDSGDINAGKSDYLCKRFNYFLKNLDNLN